MSSFIISFISNTAPFFYLFLITLGSKKPCRICILKTEYIALIYFYLKMELWRACCLCMVKGETRHKHGQTLKQELGNVGLQLFVGRIQIHEPNFCFGLNFKLDLDCV